MIRVPLSRIRITRRVFGLKSTFHSKAALNSIIGIIGAVPYRTISGKRYICLFVKVGSAGAQRLRLLKLNLDSGVWDGGTIELPFPSAQSSFGAVIGQNDHEEEPPYLLLTFSDGTLHEGHLNSEADGWDRDIAPTEDLGGQVLEM